MANEDIFDGGPLPECDSPNINLTAPGLLRNSYLCNSCKQPFTRLAPTWFSTVAAIGSLVVSLRKEVGGLLDDVKRLFSNDPNVGRPEARATLPPRQRPRRQPTPPVHPKRHSASPNRLDPHKAVTFNDRGVTYCQKGELDHGIVYLSQAIELKPDYMEALNNRGYAYNLKRKYKLAIDDLDRAIELQPPNATVFHNRAEVYLIQGQYPLAIRYLTQAIKLNPNFADAFELCSHARRWVGDIKGAVSDAASAKRVGSRGHNPFLPGTDAADIMEAMILTMSASFTNSSTIQVNWTTDKSTIGFVAGASATQFGFGAWPMISGIAGGYGTNHSTVLTVPSGMTPVYVSAVVKTIGGLFSHTTPFAVSATIPVPQSPRPRPFGRRRGLGEIQRR